MHYIFSCSKDEPLKNYTAKNEQEILAYIEKHNLDATKGKYGVYSVIEKKGRGLQPIYENTDVVTVSFTNGNFFDEIYL